MLLCVSERVNHQAETDFIVNLSVQDSVYFLPV